MADVKIEVAKNENGQYIYQYIYRMTKPVRFYEQAENGTSQIPCATDGTEATPKACDEIPGKGRFCV